MFYQDPNSKTAFNSAVSNNPFAAFTSIASGFHDVPISMELAKYNEAQKQKDFDNKLNMSKQLLDHENQLQQQNLKFKLDLQKQYADDNLLRQLKLQYPNQTFSNVDDALLHHKRTIDYNNAINGNTGNSVPNFNQMSLSFDNVPTTNTNAPLSFANVNYPQIPPTALNETQMLAASPEAQQEAAILKDTADIVGSTTLDPSLYQEFVNQANEVLRNDVQKPTPRAVRGVDNESSQYNNNIAEKYIDNPWFLPGSSSSFIKDILNNYGGVVPADFGDEGWYDRRFNTLDDVQAQLQTAVNIADKYEGKVLEKTDPYYLNLNKTYNLNYILGQHGLDAREVFFIKSPYGIKLVEISPDADEKGYRPFNVYTITSQNGNIGIIKDAKGL